MEQKCSLNGLHDGPFALYLWVEKRTTPTPRGYRNWSAEHRSTLCESCARRVGAWKLPAKPLEYDKNAAYSRAAKQVEEYDPNYHGDDETPDDTPQPNNNLRGNPYR